MSFGDKCKYCGCTDERACVRPDGEPCYWIMHNICSECFPKCTEEEKKDAMAIFLFGTYFSMINPKNQEKVLRSITNGNKI